MAVRSEDAKGVAQLLHRSIQDFQIAPLGVILGQLEQGSQNAGELIGIDEVVLRAQPFVDLCSEIGQCFVLLFHLCRL